MKQRTVLFILSCTLLAMLLSVSASQTADIGVRAATATFKMQVEAFTISVQQLNDGVKALSKDTGSIIKARKLLLNARLRYKRIAFFTSYFFPSETKLYNAPPKYEVEEPELELEEPMGLQQIEALLFDADPVNHKAELIAQTDALYTSAKDLPTLLFQFKANDRQVLESLRLELIRIPTLYVSGYDAPLLKSGVTEALEASLALQKTLRPYLSMADSEGQVLGQTLARSIAYLSKNQDFNSFDRMAYLTDFCLPLQRQLGVLIKVLHLELNTTAYLNYNAPDMFSAGFLNPWDSIPQSRRQAMVSLGKRLFFDKSLSGTLQVSCSTCHKPELYFTDGRFRSTSIVHDSVLKRNTPTLLYAGYQHTQFWDGRAADMKTQIKTVLFNPLEMGGNAALLQKNIFKKQAYRLVLNKFIKGVPTPGRQLDVIANAIGAYVGSLSPLNSPFDQYLRGDKKAIRTDQIKGFNLFMGKAQCGTCHFAPYFNSLVPPLFDVSETEILGTPRTDQLEKPVEDTDPGRYGVYQIRYYRKAFKTPTVRNTQKTGPYMHNGAFKTLKGVLDFYNKGGGNGIGLHNEDQTLPSQPLNLSEPEINQIIQFINALTDAPNNTNHSLKTNSHI